MMGGAGLFTLITPYSRPTNAPTANDMSRPFIAASSIRVNHAAEMPWIRKQNSHIPSPRLLHLTCADAAWGVNVLRSDESVAQHWPTLLGDSLHSARWEPSP